MLKKENSRGFDGSSNNWARVCDSCHSVTCTVYCRTDSTYLCSGCDARIHAASLVASHHKRVWICEACKRAPAAFLCKADVASLCASCNADIHSANLLAHRHHRVPIIPIPEYLLKFSKSTIAIESKKRKKEAKISSMLKKENSWGFDGSNNNWGRVCDSCHSTACTVYCQADSSYLCEDYDIHIHAANMVASSHECICVCEACECAPAPFLCKADAASLCASCDADIHSVNPLARRHHRVPVMPIPGSLYGPSAVDTIGGGTLMIGGPAGESTEDYEFLSLTQDAFDMTIDEEDEDEAVSWLLLNPPVKNSKSNINNNDNNQSNNYGMLFGGELVDDFLDLAEYGGDSQFNDQYSVNQQQQHFSVPQKSYGGDSVVPIQDGQGKSLILYHQRQQQQSHHLNFMLGMKYDNSNTRYGHLLL